MLLTEVLYDDIYPKAFVTFRQKWLAIPREQWTGLYVNFSNYNSDILQKTPYRDPDHQDPVGTYGYPLDYVIDHPVDVWYGQRAKFMRLLHSQASNILDLQQPMSEEQVLDLLSRIEMKQYPYHWENYPKAPREFLKLALERFRYSGANRFTKAMLSVVQTRLQYNRKTTTFDGVTQTKRLRAMGFDAVVDYGATEFEAVINSREPEQIIFLTRAAFTVEETVTLRPDLDPGQRVTHYDTKDSFRKLAGMICAKIGDHLTTQFKDLMHMAYHTKAGRRLNLRADFAKMKRSSIKVHRGADVDTKEDVMVEFYTEFGVLKQTYPSDWSFEQIADNVASWFASVAHQRDVSFKPRQLSTDEPRIGQAVQHWRTLAQRYGVPWPTSVGEKGAALIADATQQIDNSLRPFWTRSRRFKPAIPIEAARLFWSQQRDATVLPAMTAILTRLAKDRRIQVNDLSSIQAAASAPGP